MSKEIQDMVKKFIETTGSLTLASAELGVSRRQLARYRDGEAVMSDEIKERFFDADIKTEISDIDLINNYIESAGSLTSASLLLGVSRRQLARYRDGIRELPEYEKSLMMVDHMENMVSEEVQIPKTLPKSLEDDHVLYFNAQVGYSNSWGGESQMPLITVAESVDYSDENRPYIVIKGTDDCVILVNPDKVKSLVADYRHEEDNEVQYYRRMAMSFSSEERNISYTVGSMGMEKLDIGYDDETAIDELKTLVDDGNFIGYDKENISLIIMDKVASETYLNILQEKILQNVVKKTNSFEI